MTERVEKTEKSNERDSCTGEKQKFSITKLQQHCQKLFGVSSSAFAGATSGKTEEYTIGEVKKIIDEWNKKEVK